MDSAREHMDAKPLIKPLVSAARGVASGMHLHAATVPFLGGRTLTLRKLCLALAVCLCFVLRAPDGVLLRAQNAGTAPLVGGTLLVTSLE